MNYKEFAQQYGWMGYLMYRWKENDCPGGPLPDGVIDRALGKISAWRYPGIGQ
jgi:hypothetical protein